MGDTLSEVYSIEVNGRLYISSDAPIERPTMTQEMGTSLYEKAQFLKHIHILEIKDGERLPITRQDLRLIFLEAPDV